MNTFNQVIHLYITAKRAQRLSPNTLSDYQNTFRRFGSCVGEGINIRDIDSLTVATFLAGLNGVSKKTVKNYHTALSSLWTWCKENGYVENNILHQVKPPKPEIREIAPHTRDEINRLLFAALEGKYPERDQAIVLFLLDTGIRASELGSIRMGAMDLSRRTVIVIGKGSKERQLKFSENTAHALNLYIQAWKIKQGPKQTVFLTDKKTTLDRHALRLLLERLGARARLPGVHPHRFRHTFAINFLRNGGNIYVLQKLLGHTTLDMVKRYLSISQNDIELFYDQASPVARWGLCLPVSGP